MDLVDPEDRFEPYMFMPKGTFYDTPLNHYIRLQVDNGKYEFWANAANMYKEFGISRRNGYRAMKELITCAKEELSQACTAEGCTCNVQEEGPSDGGRDPSVPGGVDH